MDKLHKVLLNHLKRNKLDFSRLPDNLIEWQNFLYNIHRSYVAEDNDRYLLERSMTISSNEMMDLNNNLMNAQKTALLGYGNYDLETKSITWSLGLYYILGINPESRIHHLGDFYKIVTPSYQETLEQLIINACENAVEFNEEIKLSVSQGEEVSKWFRIIGKPIQDSLSDKVVSLNLVIIDINAEKLADEKVQELNRKLIDSARRAGMADVATSILHNVGNILNSANVSTAIVIENITDPAIKKMNQVKELFATNLDQFAEYITHDEKGKVLPAYVVVLCTRINDIHEAIRQETENLTLQLQYIRDITAMQKDISGVSEMNETIPINQLIDSAIMMCDPAIVTKKIKVVRACKESLFIKSDRSKIIQILVNLIQNAKDSLMAVKDDREKVLTISCHRVDSQFISIVIEDNGVGISAEVMKKIYTFGFTTKLNGHGFGMHSSSLAAKELKGELSGKSEGIDMGAVFTLMLPIELSPGDTPDAVHQHESDSDR